jgi:hypothetical protein
MFVLPYSIDLANLGEDKVTLPYPNPTILPPTLSNLGHPAPSTTYGIRSNILPYGMNPRLTPKFH